MMFKSYETLYVYMDNCQRYDIKNSHWYPVFIDSIPEFHKLQIRYSASLHTLNIPNMVMLMLTCGNCYYKLATKVAHNLWETFYLMFLRIIGKFKVSVYCGL